MDKIALHSLPVVADLAVSHDIIVKLEHELRTRAALIDRRYANDSWDFGKDAAILKDLNGTWSAGISKLPDSLPEVDDLIKRILGRYVDRTKVDADYLTAKDKFGTKHFVGNSSTIFGYYKKNIPMHDPDEQQNIASYLLRSNLVSASWNSAVCCAVFSGHGVKMGNSLKLYCTLKDSERVVKGHFFDISRYWAAWFNFITEQKWKGKTLIIVLDVCHSGAAIPQLRQWCSDNETDLRNSRCSVEMYTSCAENELARGGYFLRCWFQIFHDSVAGVDVTTGETKSVRDTDAEETKMDTVKENVVDNDVDEDTVPPDACLQHPCYFSSTDGSPVRHCTDAVQLYKYWNEHFGKDEPQTCFDGAWRSGGTYAVRDILQSEKYTVLDVRFFCSGNTGEPDGYQIGALLQAEETDLIWNQHVHLSSTHLEASRDWRVSENKGSSAKLAIKNEAGPDNKIITYPKAKAQGLVSVLVGASPPTTDKSGMSMWTVPCDSHTIHLFDQNSVPYKSTDYVFTDGEKIEVVSVGHAANRGNKSKFIKWDSIYIDKVRIFLDDYCDEFLYLGNLREDDDLGVQKTVREWRNQCFTLGDNVAEAELKSWWHTGASVRGLVRTRFVTSCHTNTKLSSTNDTNVDGAACCASTMAPTTDASDAMDVV